MYNISLICFSGIIPSDQSCTSVDTDDHARRLFDTSGGHTITLDYDFKTIKDIDRFNVLRDIRSRNSNIKKRPALVRLHPVHNRNST